MIEDGGGLEGIMAIAIPTGGGTAAHRQGSPARRRGLLLAALATGGGLGVLAATHPEMAAAPTDLELARLLRFMALLKAAMAAGAAAVLWWRLSAPTPPSRLLAYLAASAAMAAGPILIWTLAYVGWGALLVHGGLLALVVLLWRDPAVAAKLGDAVASRRRALAASGRSPDAQRGGGKARTSPV